MKDLECDVAIIGAGTTGLAAERSARRAGAKTLLIDDRFAGTTCARTGCMPSKLLIAAAKAAHAVSAAAIFGVEAEKPRIDGKAVMHRVQSLRDDFVASVLKSIDDLPDDAKLKGRARFVDATTLDVDGTRVRAKTIVVATGSSSAIPKPFEKLGSDRVLTNETVFDLSDLPRSLAVVGAGPLGLELAQAFARLGVDVEVFNESDKIAGLKDEKVAKSLLALLQKEMPIRLDVSLSAENSGDGVRVSWSGGATGSRTFTHVLIAAGRPPNLAKLDLPATGLALDDHGTPVFDRNTLQCGDAPIFLAGDADADAPVLHEASAEGAIAGHNAAIYPKVEPSRRFTALAITFTDPPSAVIGAPPEAETVIGEADYADQGRAKVEGRNAGLVRLYSDTKGKLTGAVMAAPEVEHMAHLIAWAIEKDQTAMDLLELPIYHPTFEEGLRTALRQICEKADVSFAADRDEGFAPGI